MSSQDHNTEGAQLKKPKKARKRMVSLNPYVCSAARALKLMGRLCTASTSERHDSLIAGVYALLRNMHFDTFVNEHRGALHNFDLRADVYDAIDEFVTAIEAESFSNKPRTKVAVAGVFNAGKSSLLNYLVKRENLLPEDIVPATVVPAYLYCKSEIESSNGDDDIDIAVYGINRANAIVTLDTDVLNCISHSTPGADALRVNTAEQIAKALLHFIVEIKHPEFENIVFIDTPGYANAQEDQSDNLTADTYTGQADMVLWLVSATSGAIGKAEWDLIDSYAPKRVVIVITKADLPSSESLEEVYYSIVEESRAHRHVADVVRMSVMPEAEHIYKSRSGASLNSILRFQTERIARRTAVDTAADRIKAILDTEMQNLDIKIKQLNDQLQRQKDKQNKKHAFTIDDYHDFSRLKNFIKECLTEDFGALIKYSSDLPAKAKQHEQRFFDKVKAYYDGRSYHPSNLNAIIVEWENSLKKLIDALSQDMPKMRHRAEDREFYVRRVERSVEKLNSFHDEELKEIAEICRGIEDRLNEVKLLKNFIKSLHDEIADWIDRQKSCLEHVQLPKPSSAAVTDMFQAIASGDVDLLIDCFRVERDATTEYDAEGRSATTFAAHCGNIEALRLLASKNKSILEMPDQRGLTPYLSAIANMQLNAARWLKATYPDCAVYTAADGRTPDDILNEEISSLSSDNRPVL